MTPRSVTNELELRDYLAVARRRKWAIAGVTLIVVAAALVASFLQTPVYEATAQVLLQPRASEEIFAPEEQAQPALPTRVDTEIEVMRSRSVRMAVTEELGREPDVAVSPVGETEVVRVRASSTDPADAAEEANIYADTYIKTRRSQRINDLLATSEQVQAKVGEIESELAALPPPPGGNARRQALENRRDAYLAQLDQLDLASELTQTGGAQVISEAREPTSPARPTPVRNAALALGVGLVLGVGVAFLRDHLDDSIKTKEDLEQASSGLSVLGLIPAVPKWRDRKRPVLVSVSDASSPVSEAYRALRTSVRFLGLDRRLQVLELTSSVAAEGKTTTVANLGVAMARAGARVVVIDCDLRRPRLHDFFQLDNTIGFTSVLLGEVSLSDALVGVPSEKNLYVLPSGPPPPNPSELLSGRRVEELLDRLRKATDIVLIDAPPVLPVSDARILSGVVDGVALVASSQRATATDVSRSVELLNQVGAPLLGTVLNGIGTSAAYGDGYHYDYGYQAETKPPKRKKKRRAQATPDGAAVNGNTARENAVRRTLEV
jgi:capsular exopolysaccharide synthesis family protein